MSRRRRTAAAALDRARDPVAAARRSRLGRYMLDELEAARARGARARAALCARGLDGDLEACETLVREMVEERER